MPLGRGSRAHGGLGMTGVGRISRAAPGADVGAARRAAGLGGGFAVGFSAASTAGPGSGTASVASVAGMLLLQEVADGPARNGQARDRQARRHGRALLEGLSDLQRALLGDGEDTAALDRLATLVAHCPEAADPALRATLAAVALRAKVELARREL